MTNSPSKTGCVILAAFLLALTLAAGGVGFAAHELNPATVLERQQAIEEQRQKATRDDAFWRSVMPAQVDAYLSRRRLKAHTPNTVTDPQRLRAILARIRQDGYAGLEEEYVLGGSATAAPVLQSDGTVIAALNVGTVSSRYPAAKRRIIAAVVRAAARISQRLGYRRAA